ncbi:MAG: single-stranded-DNA-specific exonuclease RecJ [Acidiferrobacteraceae bacterium]
MAVIEGVPPVRRRIERRPLPEGVTFSASLIDRLFSARGADGHDPGRRLESLRPPSALKDIDRATGLLEDALVRTHKIMVVADFDVDGATSCALAVRALRACGADVRYIVPNRFEYGYGLTPEIVDLAATHHPDLLMTVDQGTTSVEGVARAHALGLKVLITDHHLCGEVLPDADALVNPNQPGDTSGATTLAGVGVALYVMIALRARLRDAGWFALRGIPEPNLAKVMDLVALGTVADVVPLDGDNRLLVREGLKRINRGQACAGIAALLRVARRSPGLLSAADLGFAVAPRLNAAGRLSDMSTGIDCLLTDHLEKAEQAAAQLDALNLERRAIEERMVTEGLGLLDGLEGRDKGALPWGLCIFDETWHQGVIGILAGRLKERFHRPVIAFADAGQGFLKGSGRSIPGLHLRDVLQEISAARPALLDRFGGHAMAVGLTLARDRLDEFGALFDTQVRKWLTVADLERVLWTDGSLAAAQLTLETAELLHAAGPWGQSFPEPVFDNCFRILEQRVVGSRHLRLKLRTTEGGATLDAIAFNQEPCPEREIRAVFRLDINEYQGARRLQLVVEHLEPASPAAMECRIMPT